MINAAVRRIDLRISRRGKEEFSSCTHVRFDTGFLIEYYFYYPSRKGRRGLFVLDDWKVN